MGVQFTPREHTAMQALVADNARDILLKTDRSGTILDAGPVNDQVYDPLPRQLIGRALFDLVHPQWAQSVRADHAAALTGRQNRARLEFPLQIDGLRDGWYELRLSCLVDELGQVYGTVGIMRSIQERRSLEDKLFAASLTDALTGLSNRQAFVAMVQHLIDRRVGGSLALFAIDHLKLINMRYGQAVGDEVLVVFADLVRTVMRSQDIVSRIGGETLAVLLPGSDPARSERACRRVIETLAEGRGDPLSGAFSVTASAGLARIENSLDLTLKRAELALFHARAKGRNRLEIDGAPRLGRAA
jgi:diguanylate cyclase (GGDEF)-like protein/PAS domain S-box-containing protein